MSSWPDNRTSETVGQLNSLNLKGKVWVIAKGGNFSTNGKYSCPIYNFINELDHSEFGKTWVNKVSLGTMIPRTFSQPFHLNLKFTFPLITREMLTLSSHILLQENVKSSRMLSFSALLITNSEASSPIHLAHFNNSWISNGLSIVLPSVRINWL